jgi:hypothetical protein
MAMAKTNVVRPWRAASGKEAELVLPREASRSIGGVGAARERAAERYASRPHHRAEDLVYEAWEAPGPRRAELARQALALWPDCADAYVLLARACGVRKPDRAVLVEDPRAPANPLRNLMHP